MAVLISDAAIIRDEVYHLNLGWHPTEQCTHMALDAPDVAVVLAKVKNLQGWPDTLPRCPRLT